VAFATALSLARVTVLLRTRARACVFFTNQDRVGKAGWIAERCPDADGSGADGGLTLRLNFSAFLPRLSVTYLETYRGAGRVQVSVRRLGTGLTDVGDAPAQLLPSTDACAFVDAFKQETKHSQVQHFLHLLRGKSARY
jgi:hypothetical protein